MVLFVICAPITLFVYNRPDHTRRTIDALRQNKLAQESDFIILSDAAKAAAQEDKVREVRQYIHQIGGFRPVTVVERAINFGLAKSIVDGVTSIVNQYGRIIVLEDDMVTSPFFLTYMNQALEMYAEDDRVISIHGYVYPVNKLLPESFFFPGADCFLKKHFSIKSASNPIYWSTFVLLATPKINIPWLLLKVCRSARAILRRSLELLSVDGA